jgi:gamma-glutamyltranspeptidase / glutathione hydrolase
MLVMAHRGTVVARGGAIAASQPLAVSAGLSVLARGGTFADAAIAASAVLCVVEPQNSHIGGDAFLVVYDAETRNTVAFNGSGAAPQAAHPERYPDGIPIRGLRASTVPGLVSTWGAFHERYGSIPLAELLAPAIAYAEDGYPVGPRVARVCAANEVLFAAHPSLHSLGLHPGIEVGDTVRQPNLAWTLRQIAEHGPDAFYRGKVAERIVMGSGGYYQVDDLVEHHTRTLTPLRARYRDLLIHGQPPPSQGHILLQELQLVSGYRLAELDGTARNHLMVEAKKLAFADRNAYLADPEKAFVPIDALLMDDYAERRRALIELDRAAAHYDPGDPHQSSDTTYFLVRDAAGNAVSFIQSIFHGFGCAEVIEGTGILFNNRLTGFSLDPASSNFLAPGKRPAHTLNAWLATHEDGSLAYVGGTPGGHVQVQTSLQLIVNLVDLGMDPQAAIEMPRWQHVTAESAVASHPGGTGILEIEERAGSEVVDGLRARGHDVRLIGPWAHGSSAQVLKVLPSGAVALGSDPRCDGHAAGL